MVRLFLFVQCVLFAAFGTAALTEPLALTEVLGVEVSGRHGAYEMRGVYGGVSLGAAFLMLAGAVRTNMARPALYFLLAYTGGYTFARIVGIHYDGMPEPYFLPFVAFEAITALLSLILLVSRRNA